MKTSILFLCSLIPASAAISVNNAGPITYRMRSGQAAPIARNPAPDKGQTVTVTTTLSGWTAAVTGDLLTACRFFTQCFVLSGAFTGTSITSGVSGDTVNLNWYTPATMQYIAPGTYNGNVVFTETTGGAIASTAITVVVASASMFPTATEAKEISQGSNAGCTTQAPIDPTDYGSGVQWPYPNICPIANEAPPVSLPSVVQPALGASYTDAQFGATVTRVSSPGQFFEYGGISPFSANDSYVTHTGGTVKLSAPGSIFRALPGGYTINNLYPSATDDASYYATVGTVLSRYNYVTNTPLTLGDMSVAPIYFHGVYEGGTQGTSETNWQAFYDSGLGNTANSSTSLAIGTGSKTFTTLDGIGYETGVIVSLVEHLSMGVSGNSMTGTVTASTGSSVTLNVTAFTGSGTIATWNVGRFYPKICAVNLPLLESQGSITTSNTFCATWSPSSAPQLAGLQQVVDWVQVTEIDGPTGKRSVYMSSSRPGLSSVPPNAGSTVFSVGAAGTGTLTQEYIMPEYFGFSQNNYNGVCQTGEFCGTSANYTHNIICLDSDNQNWLYGRIADPISGVNYMAWVRLSAGLDIFRPIEAGGGLKILESQNYDIQPGCSSRVHAWSLSRNQDNDNVGVFAATVTAASYSGGVVTVTFSVTSQGSAPPSWTGSRPLLIQGATGSWTPLNGKWTSTYASGSTLTVPCTGCSASSGSVGSVAVMADASASASTAGDRGQFGVMRPGKSYNRIAMTRGWPYQAVSGCWDPVYYTISTFGSISRSGKYVGFISNYGSLDCPGGPSSYIATTGLDPAILTAYTATPAATNAILSYNVSDSSACSTDVSAGSGFSSILRTINDPGGTTARNYSLGTLTAATNYWTRTTCGQQVETAYFTTLPALTSTRSTTVQIGAITGLAGVNNVVLEYRLAGGSSYTAVTAVPCPSGCSVTWPADVGIEEYRYNWRNSGNTVLLTSQTYSMVVNR